MTVKIEAPVLPKGYKIKVRHSVYNNPFLIVELLKRRWFSYTLVDSRHMHVDSVGAESLGSVMQSLVHDNYLYDCRAYKVSQFVGEYPPRKIIGEVYAD